MSIVFTEAIRTQHARKKAERLRRSVAAAKQLAQLEMECREALTYDAALAILVRESLLQYCNGFEAKSHIPLHAHIPPIDGWMPCGTYGNGIESDLHEQLRRLLRKQVDCMFELEICVGYSSGGEHGYESQPTTVGLKLIPT